jgi:hypothetical protein
MLLGWTAAKVATLAETDQDFVASERRKKPTFAGRSAIRRMKYAYQSTPYGT